MRCSSRRAYGKLFFIEEKKDRYDRFGRSDTEGRTLDKDGLSAECGGSAYSRRRVARYFLGKVWLDTSGQCVHNASIRSVVNMLFVLAVYCAPLYCRLKLQSFWGV